MSEKKPRILVIMAREPVAGAVKARLQPALDAEQAADVHRRLLIDAIEASWAPKRWDLAIAYAPATDAAAKTFRELDGGLGLKLIPQEGAELAARMRSVFETLLESHEAVLLRNSDSPQVAPARFEEGFTALESGADVVVGPDDGGGHYALGMKKLVPEIFEVPPSTPDTSRLTKEALAEAGHRTHELPEAIDVDTIDDLTELARLLNEDEDLARRCMKTKHWIDQAIADGKLIL